MRSSWSPTLSVNIPNHSTAWELKSGQDGKPVGLDYNLIFCHRRRDVYRSRLTPPLVSRGIGILPNASTNEVTNFCKKLCTRIICTPCSQISNIVVKAASLTLCGEKFHSIVHVHSTSFALSVRQSQKISLCTMQHHQIIRRRVIHPILLTGVSIVGASLRRIPLLVKSSA
jgi:hypothetical protein